MAFADLKNDFVFRRIFATHPDILRGLLNDLLDRKPRARHVPSGLHLRGLDRRGRRRAAGVGFDGRRSGARLRS